jgi:tRNA A37 threonylcarbamoyladenosine modification protein TsaB
MAAHATRSDITLVIETSNPSAGPSAGSAGEVGLAHGDELTAARELAPSGRHDDALMPAIAELFQERGVAPAEVGRVVVSVGPGGYSSVRIAVATAKMVSMATGAACVPAPSDASAACGSGVSGTIAVAMASKSRDGGSAWVRAFEMDPDGARALEAGRVMDAEGLAALRDRTGFASLVADAHLPEAMRAWAQENGVTVTPMALTAASCLAAGAGVAPVAAMELECVYPRDPEAVRKWRELKR